MNDDLAHLARATLAFLLELPRESFVCRLDRERIRDHLIREGWSEFTIHETFDAIEDEYAIDPEGGTFLLEVHLAQARKWAH